MKLIVSPPPHIHIRDDITSIMRDVIIGLIPACIAGVYFFHWFALRTILLSILVAVLTEFGIRKITHRRQTITDLSAVVTGLLFALVLPPNLPWWITIIGAAVAISLGKQIFGGLGHNLFNPALVGRAVLLASWPVAMTTWVKPYDIVTCASPLAIVKEDLGVKLPTYWQMFIGERAGCIGETSIIALLIGAVYLLLRNRISWHIPVSYIGVVAFLSFILDRDVVFNLMAGGLVLGAFFMATDYVTSPITKNGKLVFGLGCGVMTMLIRMKGGFPEGVCYSILIMNMFTPIIDRVTMPQKFGYERKIR